MGTRRTTPLWGLQLGKHRLQIYFCSRNVPNGARKSRAEQDLGHLMGDALSLIYNFGIAHYGHMGGHMCERLTNSSLGHASSPLPGHPAGGTHSTGPRQADLTNGAEVPPAGEDSSYSMRSRSVWLSPKTAWKWLQLTLFGKFNVK
jgi:hypothetical protein